MKTPKAVRLHSGSWRVRLYIDGNTSPISITKPTKKEAEEEAIAIKLGYKKAKAKNDPTLRDACYRYIKDRENVLSVSTIAGYNVIIRNRFQGIMETPISAIDDRLWQKAVNDQAKTISAKTLNNSVRFVQTVLAYSACKRFNARTPQIVKKDLPWLTPEQIKVFVNAIEGNKYELPILIELCGLRHSEMIALKYADIDTQKNTIRISGSSVKNADGDLIDKATNKNVTSSRTIPILIPRIAELVNVYTGSKDDFVYHKYDNVLRLNINKVCKDNGLPEVGNHGLRRSFCSLCYSEGIKELTTMQWGGWADFGTMRAIYTKLSEADANKDALKFSAFFKTDTKTDTN